MGSKGAGSSPPELSGGNDMELILPMMEGMVGMMESMADNAVPEFPELPPMPDIVSTQKVDWQNKANQLSSKMKADYMVDSARRKGRSKTILTSPFLDEDEAATTGDSLLKSGVTGTMVLPKGL